MNSKIWCKLLLFGLAGVLVATGCMTAIVDPFFHYHKPLKELQYPIDNQRYQNYGIVKNFEYDAIITGTSMTENFKTSEFEELFSADAVKVPFSGGSYKEINDLLKKAYDSNTEIKYIVRGLDGSRLFDDKDAMRYEMELYPWYLYDENIVNDVEYIFNKEILCNNTVDVLLHTMRGKKTTNFDEYCEWDTDAKYGKVHVDTQYERTSKSDNAQVFSDEDRSRLAANIEQNVLDLVKENPNTDFYYFIPPYSIYWWDDCNQDGNLHRTMEAFKYMSELIVQQENVYLFCFFDEYDLITDMNNYKDTMHYSGEINSKILQWMSNGQHRLTRENYVDYWNSVEQYYSNYDYDALFN